MRSNQYFSCVQRIAAQALVGLTSLLSVAQASDVPITQEKPAYEVRGFFRILDGSGNETRRLVPGTNVYTLEAWAESPSKIEKPTFNANFQYRCAPNTQIFKKLSPSPHYGIEDFFYPYSMDSQFNGIGGGREAVVGSGARVTALDDTGSRPGRTFGAGILGKWHIQALGTNVTSGVFQYGGSGVLNPDGSPWIGLTALEEGSGEVRKPVRTRSLRVAVMPEEYAGVLLVADTNDGENPVNDGRKGYEPFYAVGSKASGNFVLQRSITDLGGPWTTVRTISPGDSGSFYDHEALTNGWSSVFYRVVSPETAATSGITPAANVKKTGQ